MSYYSDTKRRIGDPFRQRRVSNAVLPRYMCHHVQEGALAAARIQQEGAILSLCAHCYEHRDNLRLTADGKTVTC